MLDVELNKPVQIVLETGVQPNLGVHIDNQIWCFDNVTKLESVRRRTRIPSREQFKGGVS